MLMLVDLVRPPRMQCMRESSGLESYSVVWGRMVCCGRTRVEGQYYATAPGQRMSIIIEVRRSVMVRRE